MFNSFYYRLFVSLFVLLLSSCIGPRPQIMPKTTLEFLVINRETNNPIEGAQLFMIYDSPDGKIFKKGPFYTDKNGLGIVKVEKKVYWVSASYLYFAGGYLRKVQASANGYENSSFIKGYEFLEPGNGSPLIFKLTPFRNKFGSVLVLSQFNKNGKIVLNLQVVDGPNSGEEITMPIMKEDEIIDYTGKKYYFRKPLEYIRDGFENRSVTALNFPIYFREGFPNELYDPE